MQIKKSTKISRFSIFLNYTKINFKKNWFLSIFLAIFSIFSILLFLFLWELDKKFDTPIYNSQNQQVTIAKKNGQEFKNNEIEAIANLKSVKSVSKSEIILEFGSFTNKDFFDFNPFRTRIKPVEISHFFRNDMKNYANFQGRFLENDDEIIVSQDFANLKNVNLGENIDFKYWMPNPSTNKNQIIYSKKLKIVGIVGYRRDEPDHLVLISNNGYKNLVKNVFENSKNLLIQNNANFNDKNKLTEFLVQNLNYYNLTAKGIENTDFSKISVLQNLNSNKNFNLDNGKTSLRTGSFTGKNDEILVSQKLINYFNDELNLNLNVGDQITFKLKNKSLPFLLLNQSFTFKISGIFESDQLNQIQFNKNVLQFFNNSISTNQPLKVDVFYDPVEKNGQTLQSWLEKKGFETVDKIKFPIHTGLADLWPTILGVSIIFLLLTVLIVFAFASRNFKINTENKIDSSISIIKKITIKKVNLYWILVSLLVFIITLALFLISIKLPFFRDFLYQKPQNYIIGRIILDLLWISLIYTLFCTIIFKITTFFKNRQKSIVSVKNLITTEKL